jgi:chemotaxis protein methyltransferase CheR
MKARAAESRDGRLQLLDAHTRVMAVAAVQRHLELGAGEVEIGPYLRKLCESLESAMSDDLRAVAVKVRSDLAFVASREATSLGLIVAELVMNAYKHAFPDGRDGRIEVAYRIEPQGWRLTVEDDGTGRPAPGPGQRIGLGTGVVSAVARQLNARVELSDADPGARTAIVEVRSATSAGAEAALV